MPSGTVSGGDPAAGRNKRSVWTIPTHPEPEAHFATFPPALVRPCILAGCPAGGVVLDPFAGTGTAIAEAYRLGRVGLGFELNPEYAEKFARPKIEAARKGITVAEVKEGQQVLWE